jgi:class 3 adenylate cyclase
MEDVMRTRTALHAGAQDDAQEAGRETLTVVFTDVEGSAEAVERLGDWGWVDALRAQHRIVREEVAAHGGVEVKTCGDGFLLVFANPDDALDCVMAVQRRVAAAQPASGGERLKVRVGVHSGAVLIDQGDLVGRTVVLAARITASAAGGEVVMSSSVLDRCPWAPVRQTRVETFKGLAGDHVVFVLDWQAAPAVATSAA